MFEITTLDTQTKRIIPGIFITSTYPVLIIIYSFGCHENAQLHDDGLAENIQYPADDVCDCLYLLDYWDGGVWISEANQWKSMNVTNTTEFLSGIIQILLLKILR